MRWHDIRRVLDDYCVRAVCVKQHDGGARTSQTERFGRQPQTERTHPLFRWNQRQLVCAKLTANESSRTDTSDWDWFLRSVSIIQWKKRDEHCHILLCLFWELFTSKVPVKDDCVRQTVVGNMYCPEWSMHCAKGRQIVRVRNLHHFY